MDGGAWATVAAHPHASVRLVAGGLAPSRRDTRVGGGTRGSVAGVEGTAWVMGASRLQSARGSSRALGSLLPPDQGLVRALRPRRHVHT